MKFGQTLERRAPAEYAIHNIDYDDLKHVIKLHTSTNCTSRPKPIPTSENVDREEQEFEDQFLAILEEQHGRINDFVHMKSGEIERRLSLLEKQISKITADVRTDVSQEHKRYTRLQKAARLDQRILTIGRDIQSLSQLSNVNSLAFRKIIKKYRKWTKSSNLERRFRQAMLDKPSNLLDQGFDTLLAHYRAVLERSRAVQDAVSEKTGPRATQALSLEVDNHDTAYIAQKLFEDTQGSPSEFDAALATYPLSNDGLRATYWIHPENLLNVQILLLRYASVWRRGHSPEDKMSTSPSKPSLDHQASSAGTAGRQSSNLEDYTLIVCDDLPQFVVRRGSETVQDTERRSGRAHEKAAAALRLSKADIAIVSLPESTSTIEKSYRDWDFENIGILKSDSFKVFDADQTTGSRDAFTPEVIKIREWFGAHAEVKPLVRLSSRRCRFCGVSNSSHAGLWITLDDNIRMGACTKKSFAERQGPHDKPVEDAEEEQFPHAILEVRLEGKASKVSESLIRLLDHSHYLERVRGFSLETHAIFKLYRPLGMPPPLWLAALAKDIRKVPGPPFSQQQARVGRLRSHGANRSVSQTSASDPSTREDRATSLFSQKQGQSSATSMPTAQESTITWKTPQKREQRRSKTRKRPKSARRAAKSMEPNYQTLDSQHPTRYWNEFDDGSDVDHDDTYAIYLDPNASFNLPGTALAKSFYRQCSEKLGFSRPRHQNLYKDSQVCDVEREPLVGHGPSLDNSEDSDDDDDTSTLRAPGERSVGLESRFYNETPRERILLQCCLSAYALAFLMLLVSGIILAYEKGEINQKIGQAVVVCVLLSFVAVVIGSGCMIARKARMSWAYRLTVLLADLCVLIVGIFLLVVIANPLR